MVDGGDAMSLNAMSLNAMRMSAAVRVTLVLAMSVTR